MIGELAAGIAHEIRNPMASISASIQMLREGIEQDDVNARLMDIISREIGRLDDLVRDFLLFARPKTPDIKKFDLCQIIAESLELFQNSQHCTPGVKVVTDLRPPINLESDPQQIKQVLWNLFLNAYQAMGRKGALYVSAKAGAGFSQTNQDRVDIVIRDTGEGFSERALTQLFTPFFTTKEEGSGLGLAITKRIVDGLHGEVSGENHPEGGTKMTIRIPISPEKWVDE
jgi:two-component system sensor histidine kinase PilS (NtrC family)